MVMGTVAYMSPEQAVGRPLDFRSDQFSLGAVIYEMVAGRRPFERPTRPETLTAILREEPEPLSSTALATPAPLRWIVERCLAKDPDERYASTRDLARDLSQTAARLSSMSGPGPTATEAAPRKKSLARVGLVLLGAALGLVAAGVAVRVRGLGRTEAPPRLTRATFSPGLQQQPAFSPDGKFLAYVTDERGSLDIVVEPRGGGAPIRVAATDADEAHPAWSPDGTKIAFCSARDHGGRLGVVLGQGGAHGARGRAGRRPLHRARRSAGRPSSSWRTATTRPGRRTGSASSSSRIAAGSGISGRSPRKGGQPARLTDDTDFDYQPSWSPDGKWIVYALAGIGRRLQPARRPRRGRRARGADARGDVRPPPVLVARRTLDRLLGLRQRHEPLGAAGLGRQGRRPAPPHHARPEARTSMPRSAATGGPSRSRRRGRTATSGRCRCPPGRSARSRPRRRSSSIPSSSPDGKTLLAESDRTGQLALWTLDLSGRFREQVSAIDPSGGHWSPDGRQVTYVLGGTIRPSHARKRRGASTPAFASSGAGALLSRRDDAGVRGAREQPLSSSAIASRRSAASASVPGAAAVGDATWSPDGQALVAHVRRRRRGSCGSSPRTGARRSGSRTASSRTRTPAGPP